MGHARTSPILAFLAGAAVWAIFGSKIKETLSENEEVQELRKEVEKKYFAAKDYTQDAYNKIVDEATNKYAKARNISQNELQDLIADLKMHWDKIRKAWH